MHSAIGAVAAWAQVTVEDFLLRAHAEEYGQLSSAGKRQVRSFAADIWVSLVFGARDQLVKQRTQLDNAIRGHLTEYGWVAPKGTEPPDYAGGIARRQRDGRNAAEGDATDERCF